MGHKIFLSVLTVLLCAAIVAVAYICLIFRSNYEEAEERKKAEAERRKGEDNDTEEV